MIVAVHVHEMLRAGTCMYNSNSSDLSMIKNIAALLLFGMCLVISQVTRAQDSTAFLDRVINFPDKYFRTLNKKSIDYQHKLTEQTDKYLQRLARQEKKLKRKMAWKDTATAEKVFGNTDSLYESWNKKLTTPTQKLGRLEQSYSGHLDSMQTALKFIDKARLPADADKVKQQISGTLGKYEGLQSSLNTTQQIQQLMNNRQQYLSNELKRFGLVKELQVFQKEVYYYQAQAKEYKEMFEQPEKMEAKLMEVLKKQPAFKKFFSNNSQLASMFQLPGSDVSDADMGTLQTRADVMKDLEQRIGSTAGAQQAIQQGVEQGKGEMSKLKNKINELGSKGGSDADMPTGFKPNNQKTKSFRQRIELGSNLQSSGGTSYFPATSDIGVSAGYKLNDKSVIGIGASYKMGWGKDIRHISITNEGLGLRSFVDVKLKGSIWVSGGTEMNYRYQFTNTDMLKQYHLWQESALIGLSKKIALKKMKSSAQLLYDVLWNQKAPGSQPVVFRIGYQFK
jgi:hypothetical protein